MYCLRRVNADGAAATRHVLDMMRRTSPSGAAAALRARAGWPDYVGLARRIDFPVLVTAGTQGTPTPPADAEEMAGQIPDADPMLHSVQSWLLKAENEGRGDEDHTAILAAIVSARDAFHAD